jgi:hypothetical protein
MTVPHLCFVVNRQISKCAEGILGGCDGICFSLIELGDGAGVLVAAAPSSGFRVHMTTSVRSPRTASERVISIGAGWTTQFRPARLKASDPRPPTICHVKCHRLVLRWRRLPARRIACTLDMPARDTLDICSLDIFSQPRKRYVYHKPHFCVSTQYI